MKETNNDINLFKFCGVILVFWGCLYLILSIEGSEFWQLPLVFGLLMSALGAKVFIGASKPGYNLNSGIDKYFWRFLFTSEQMALRPFPDTTPNHFYISNFKNYLNDFFSKTSLSENEDILGFVDQIYYNILRLQHRRLEKNKLKIKYLYERKKGTDDMPSIIENSFFDGKYNVENVVENVMGSVDFEKNEITIHSQGFNASFNYTITDVKQLSDNEIVCPNCGAKSSRSNLIDGCDYCGAKFRIEDLGKRVSSFGIFNDLNYLIKGGEKFLSWIAEFVKFSLLCLLLSFPTLVCIDGPESSGEIFALAKIILLIVVCLLLGLSLTLTFFVLLFSPFVLIAKILTRKRENVRDKILADERENLQILNQIKDHDPLFSRSNFASSVQNKIASIHYADSASEINAFSKVDLSNHLDDYANVVDVACESLKFKEYSVDADYQKISADIALKLVRYDGKYCESETENISLTLLKSASCKTQAVCAPTLSRCTGCGSSISIFEGKKCPVCGKETRLEEQDWVITEYKKI